eukprot:gene17915-biopygen715
MKRRQVKIRCKAKGCNSQFNSDYRLQHNREKHEGKNVPYETAGAVKNPFEAAKRKKDNPIEEKDSSSSSSSEKILDDKTEEIGLANSAKEESVSKISNVVGENVVDEESESEAENSENDDTDDENDDYWISCAGKLKHLLSTLEQRGDAVRHRMVKELEEVSAFSVMADTTPDTSNKDQMAIVVRYVVNAKPVERLLCLRILKDKSGEGHAAEILKALNECSVDPQKLVFQSYDFAS